ncbi:MAG: PAS domain S-box protein [Candidatus Odinarchaeota archaeon]
MMFRILLVDDDIHYLELTRIFLSEEEPSFELIETSCPREALHRASMESFDAIVSDYQMSGMDGLELLEQLRKNNNTTPFIIFTGRGREEVAMRALNLGADYYLMKGSNPRTQYGELAHIIRQVVSHRRVEKAFKETQERYRAIVETSPDAIILVDLDLNILMTNQQAVQMFGFGTPEEALRKTIDDFISCESHERVLEDLQRVLASGTVKGMEHILLKRDGTFFPVEISASIITDGEGCPEKFMIVLKDITECKKAREVLFESEKQYRTLFQELPIGIVTCDTQGRILSVNKQALEFLGSPSEEATKQINLSTFPPLVKAGISGDLKECLETGREVIRERPYTSKWGKDSIYLFKMVPVQNEEGKIEQAIIAFDDVGRIRQIERALRDSEEKYRQIAKAVSESIIVINDRIIKKKQAEKGLVNLFRDT